MLMNEEAKKLGSWNPEATRRGECVAENYDLVVLGAGPGGYVAADPRGSVGHKNSIGGKGER